MRVFLLGVLALALTGCTHVEAPPPKLVLDCAAYELQLAAAEKAVAEGKLTGADAAAEKARLEALPERAGCLGGIY